MLRNYKENRQQTQNLFVRNVLNALFIVLSIIAMVGIAWTMSEPEIPSWCYVVGIVAVIIKMVEAMMRMTTTQKKPRRSKFDKTN